MAVSWVGGTTSTYVTATSISDNLPSGIQDDDGVFAFVFARSAITPPAGWALLDSVTFTGASLTQTLACYRKESVSSSDSGTSVSFTQASSNRFGLTFAVVRAATDAVLMAEIDTDSRSDSFQSSMAVPVLRAEQDGELALMAGSNIVADNDPGSTTEIRHNSGGTVFSGAEVYLNRLGGSYWLRDDGEDTGGSFAWYEDDGSPLAASTGIGTLALRLFDDALEGTATGPAILGAPEVTAAIDVDTYASDSSVLGAPAVLAGVDGTWAAAATMLGAPSVLGASVAGYASAGSVLGSSAVLGVHDFSGQLSGTTEYYVMDVSGGASLLRVPISSWQGTLQTDRKQFLQASVPDGGTYIDALTTRKAADAWFIISRGVRFSDGTTYEYEIARAPLEQLNSYRGSLNWSVNLTGYTDAATAVDDPEDYARDLQGIRTLTSGSTVTVRCAVDWLLRPGHQAAAGDYEFTVDYINYFVGADKYMDVGNRTA